MRLLRNSFTTLFDCFLGFGVFFSFKLMFFWSFRYTQFGLSVDTRFNVVISILLLAVDFRFHENKTRWRTGMYTDLCGEPLSTTEQKHTENIRKQMVDNVPQKRKVYDLSYNSVLIICWLVAREWWQLWVELNTEQLNLPTLDSFISSFLVSVWESIHTKQASVCGRQQSLSNTRTHSVFSVYFLMAIVLFTLQTFTMTLRVWSIRVWLKFCEQQ